MIYDLIQDASEYLTKFLSLDELKAFTFEKDSKIHNKNNTPKTIIPNPVRPATTSSSSTATKPPVATSVVSPPVVVSPVVVPPVVVPPVIPPVPTSNNSILKE
jgi:hypothetical protein